MITQHLTASGLMIGDWVKVTDDDSDEYFFGIVCEIDRYNVIVVKSGDSVGYPYAEECIEPVPLTPEILEKNGFKHTDQGGGPCIIGEWKWGDKGKRNFTIVTITFYKGLNSGVRLLTKIETDCSYESGINMIHSCDIESVHELQHALKLCGISKEIVI